MKIMEPPTCRLCEQKHWARDGCAGGPLRPSQATNRKLSALMTEVVQIEKAAMKKTSGLGTGGTPVATATKPPKRPKKKKRKATKA